MTDFKVGYSKLNINPPLGIVVCGYYVKRFAKGFLDDLHVKTIAIGCGDKTIIMSSIDVCYLPTELADKYRSYIELKTGISYENIFICATHTHTGPELKTVDVPEVELSKQYIDFLMKRISDSVQVALNDMKTARLGYRTVTAPDNIAFIRRYKMKNGTTMTCPPYDKVDEIDHPIGIFDNTVNVIRFDRDGGQTIVIVNYGIHADTVNGDMISSDFPHWLSSSLYKALDGAECMFFPGAQGDIGSTNLHPADGDMNDTEISFDNEMKSPGMARFVGRALAGAVLEVFDKVKYIDVNEIDVIQKDIFVDANVPDKKDLPLAYEYIKLHEEGRDSEIPYEAMELTTVIAEAYRMRRLENAPNDIKLTLMGIRMGEIAFVGIPGEPFAEIGKEIKDTKEWGMILPCGLTNGYEGYFPVKSAFDEGGYEARASRYKRDVADKLISGSKELLNSMK